MESDAFALRTALFTLLGSILLAGSWVIFKDSRGDYKPYVVVTGHSVSGMAVQSRVYYKGVEVGTVEEIYFGEKDYDRVRILIHIDHAIPIAENTFAQLALRGITGEYDLRLENDGPLGAPVTTSKESPAIIEMHAEYISKLGDTIRQTLADIGEASKQVSGFLSDESQQEMLRMLVNVGDAAERLTALEGKLVPTLDELPSLIIEIEKTLNDYRQLAHTLSTQTDGFNPAMAQFAAASASIERLVDELRSQTLASADSSLAAIDKTSLEFTLLLEDLRQDPQRLLLGAPGPGLGPGEKLREDKP